MSDPGNFREIARTVRIEYPIPYICVVLAALALGCFGWAAFQSAPVAWVAEALGVLAGIAAIGLPIYAVLRRSELLRSERHSLVSRAFDIFLDPETSVSTREQAGRIVDAILAGEGVTKQSAAKQRGAPPDHGTEAGND